MRDTPIVTEEIYHICNMAIEGRKIFITARDCRYFLETIMLVNTTDNRNLGWRRTALRETKKQKFDTGRPLAAVYSLSLMPNHFHMLLKQLVNGGISTLLHRSCDSYGKYYNQKYQRKGSLFMGRYKAVHINSDSQAAHIFSYIHGNPLDIKDPGWREGNIKNWTKARKFIECYPWSSLGVYTGTIVDPLIKKIIDQEFAENYFSNRHDHLDTLREWSHRYDKDTYLE